MKSSVNAPICHSVLAIMLSFSLLLLSACSEKPDLKIGFLGGISGRVADLGIGCRNGAMLALEIRNANGGINGQTLTLLSEDDQQDASQAKIAFGRLIGQKVEAVIGPMTSSMAVVVTPLANKAEMLLMSPTATTTSLAGKDDYFMRVISPTTKYAQKSADYHYRIKRLRRTAVVHDLRNRAYTESWLNDYRQAFESAGGKIEMALGFESNNEIQFSDMVKQVLSNAADSVLILANSVDTALIVQQIRQQNEMIHISTSEWAATERLLELGGRAVEGIVAAQFLDRENNDPGYLNFRKAYLKRFGSEPGFAGLTGFDAANVLLDALENRQSGQSLKQSILQQQTFTGAQSTLVFDDSGDADRATFMTTIKDGSFQRLR